MRHFGMLAALISGLFLASCLSGTVERRVGGIKEHFEQKDSKSETKEEKAQDLFFYLAVLSAIAGVAGFALKSSYIGATGLNAAIAFYSIYVAIGFLVVIKWLVIGSILLYGGIWISKRVAKLKGDVDKSERVADELAKDFDTDGGHENLSPEAIEKYVNNTDKDRKYHPWRNGEKVDIKVETGIDEPPY